MADKRMMSKKIIHSDAFLDLPAEAQLLFFHLNMSADERFFIRAPKSLMRIINVEHSNLDLLIEKGFVKKLEEGVEIHVKARPYSEKEKRVTWHYWKKIRLAVFEKDNFTCQYCGASNVKLECDHIIPISKGGSNDFENLTTACVTCNRTKSDSL